MALALAILMAVLFRQSFLPGRVHFSNDGPYAMQATASLSVPEAFTGTWMDLNTIGLPGGAWSPTLANLLRWATGPEGFAKWLAPVAQWLAGLCAWYFFRRRGLSLAACAIGSLTVALNSEFFSTSCWGVASQVIAFGLCYAALGLVSFEGAPGRGLLRWVRYALAGLAVGMAVSETGDIGALFSLLAAAAICYGALLEERPLATRLGAACTRTAVIAAFAGFLAAQAVFSLVTTQIQGVSGTRQDARTKAEKWNWATQWSLPKVETLSIVVPGLFGYRADTGDGAIYWGLVGCDPTLDTYFEKGRPAPAPGGMMRFIGSGFYAGVPVVLIALWAAAQSLRRKDSVFEARERKYLWFWGAVAVVCLLLSYGRFAPFYRLIYALPYFSTIRNPTKFLHLMTFALLILFAYGVEGLCRRYLAGAGEAPADKRHPFDRRWLAGCLAALGLGLLGWFAYSASRAGLEQYIQTIQFDALNARILAGFSIRRAGWFVGWLAASTGLLALFFYGKFAGSRARWGALLLGGLVAADLVSANQRWISYWTISEKYASNPVVDLLAAKPFEHRVGLLPFAAPSQEIETFNQLYKVEWAQQLFPLLNIQSIDVIQLPRVPAEIEAFEKALKCDQSTVYRLLRKWELTNTRYLLGASGFYQSLNKQVDPVRQRFRLAATFDLVPKPGIEGVKILSDLTASPKPNGQFAVFEFTGALPRARLYTRWQVNTNDDATLAELASPDFNPWDNVLVSSPVAGAPQAANSAAASVDFVSYRPKHIVLQSKADAPGILLFNDRYHPDWKALVDGKPQPLLRCNYIMRGIEVPAGNHTVEMLYRPPSQLLYVTISALALGVLLLGVLAVTEWKQPKPVASGA
jgi:hypothetical protein